MNYSKTLTILATIIGLCSCVPSITAMEDNNTADAKFQLYADNMLVQAVAKRNYPMAQEALAYHKANPNTKDSEGSPALCLAAKKCASDIVRLLLVSDGINPNIRDASGSTALHYAACMGILPCLKELLRHPKIIPNSTDAEDKTPLVGLVEAAQEFMRYDTKISASMGECFKILWQDKRVERGAAESYFVQDPALRKALFKFLVPTREQRAHK